MNQKWERLQKLYKELLVIVERRADLQMFIENEKVDSPKIMELKVELLELKRREFQLRVEIVDLEHS